MSLIEVNWSPTSRQLRQFGVLCFIALPVLSWLWGTSSTGIAVWFLLGALLAGTSFVRPQALRPLFVGLILVTAPLGMIVGEIALLLIYFAIFFPISLLFRIARRDALQLKIDKTLETYWQSKSEPKDASSYYRRY